MIPKSFITEVLDRTNIEHLISNYVSLKRAGSRLVGLCPFHNEKTPSFTVFSADNSFYCFGCGTGGDAITFVSKIENLDYPDAIEFLAKRIGLTVPEDPNGHYDLGKPKVERKRILEMNREAARYFHARLFDDNDDAKNALAYLTEKRWLDITTIKHFGLGFAPNQYQALSDYLVSRGYTDAELTEGYMAFKHERTGSLTDSFRNRIMFPIIDPAGNVIAFGGRVTDDSLPKYKNTSDTPAFKKSKHLFALNFAKNACAESLILCEGYMDVIALHAAGFENAVATLGTAITPEQARIISRYTKLVIISYDMDEAGRKAADKAMRLFEEVGLEVKLLKLEDAKDPDEYIKKFGRDKFGQKLKSSVSKFTYNLDRILKQYDITDPQQRIEAVGALLQMISDIPAAAERDIYLREISQQFNVGIESLRHDLDRIMRSKARKRSRDESQAMMQKTLGYRDDVNPDFAKSPSIARYEEAVLGILLLHPELRTEKGAPTLTEEDFYSDFGRRVFRYIVSLSEDNEAEEDRNINAIFTPDEVGRITKMKVSRMALTDNGMAVYQESVKTLKNAVAGQATKAGVQSLDDLLLMIAKKANKDDE